MNREEEQILKTIATAHDLVKNDNYLEACQSLEVAIELLHTTGKTGKPI